MQEIKIKLTHPDAKVPTKSHDTDSGFDVYAVSEPDWFGHRTLIYDLGFSVEIPEGYDLKLYPRSSIYKTDLILNNSVGCIDENFRGNMVAIFRITGIGRLEAIDDPSSDIKLMSVHNIYHKGDRIGQLVLEKRNDAKFIIVDELSDSDRGTGGFGSTGK